MRLLPALTLIIASAAIAGCGTTGKNRFNEAADADHVHYDHDVVDRAPAYGDRYDVDEDREIVYVRPAYRVVPVERDDLIYGGDGYYYYRD